MLESRPNTQAARTSALSVSELNRQVKRLLEVSYNKIWVTGEISSFSRPGSGHWYFSLKDRNAQVRCAMFKGFNQRLRFIPKEGDEILALVKVSLYEGRGDYQLIVENIEPAGVGQLQAAFDALKQKLALEGLFNDENKQRIPTMPRRVCVITSATGAVVHDIISVTKRRFPALDLHIIPVQVQGEQAAREIAHAIELANHHQSADVVIVGRGGGSLEDLWAFNEEVVARAIFSSRIPVISAVGHEVDFTIADFVADYRAPTPSAAAEKVTPDQYELMQSLDQYNARIEHVAKYKIKSAFERIMHLRARLKHPGELLTERVKRMHELKHRLNTTIRNQIGLQKNQLEISKAKLAHHTPNKQLERHTLSVSHLKDRLQQQIQKTVELQQHKLALAVKALHISSPLATLGRGYAIVGNKDKPVIRSHKEVQSGDTIHATLNDGMLKCTVDEVKADNQLS